MCSGVALLKRIHGPLPYHNSIQLSRAKVGALCLLVFFRRLM